MLPQWWRLRFINETGQTMTYNDGARLAIRIQPWKLVSGVLTYDTVITEAMGFTTDGTIADDGEVEGTVVDNSSEKQWGANGTFEITHDLDAASGVVRLYFEGSDNDGNWPSDSSDHVITDLRLVKTMAIDNSAVDKSRSRNFVL